MEDHIWNRLLIGDEGATQFKNVVGGLEKCLRSCVMYQWCFLYSFSCCVAVCLGTLNRACRLQTCRILACEHCDTLLKTQRKGG
jgi:hypothetical protein